MWKLYIPQTIKIELVKEIHELYAHGGVQRTIKLFKENFTTDKLNETTKEIVKTYDKCQCCKDSNQQLHEVTKAIITTA